jgi:hypothetical protein
MTALSFWQWAASDLLDNVTRGLLAEYLVFVALGSSGGPRSAWDSVDVRTPSGLHWATSSGSIVSRSLWVSAEHVHVGLPGRLFAHFDPGWRNSELVADEG